MDIAFWPATRLIRALRARKIGAVELLDLYAEPLDRFPSPSRVTIMKWFSGWLDRQGLDPAAVWGTHSDVPATKEHLEKLKATPM